jgi:hypothetical protein
MPGPVCPHANAEASRPARSPARTRAAVQPSTETPIHPIVPPPVPVRGLSWLPPHARMRLAEGTYVLAAAGSVTLLAFVVRNTLNSRLGFLVPCSTCCFFLAHVLLMPPDVRTDYDLRLSLRLRVLHGVCVLLLAAHFLVAAAAAWKNGLNLPSCVILLGRLISSLFSAACLVLARRGTIGAWTAVRAATSALATCMLIANEVRALVDEDFRRSFWLYMWIASLLVGAAACTPKWRTSVHESLFIASLAAMRSNEFEVIAATLGFSGSSSQAQHVSGAGVHAASRACRDVCPESEFSSGSSDPAVRDGSRQTAARRSYSHRSPLESRRRQSDGPRSASTSSALSSAASELGHALVDTADSLSVPELTVYPLLPQFCQDEAVYFAASITPRLMLHVRNGQMVDWQGNLLAPSSEAEGLYVMDGHGSIFTTLSMDRDPEIVQAVAGRQLRHSSLVAGGQVAAAGLVTVSRGRLISLNNESGHYAPPPSCLRAVLHQLAALGVTRVDEIRIETHRRLEYEPEAVPSSRAAQATRPIVVRARRG